MRNDADMGAGRLGWRQKEILDALASGPRTTIELNACMDDPGPISITLTRSALALLEQRGLLRRREASYRPGQPIVWELRKP